MVVMDIPREPSAPSRRFIALVSARAGVAIDVPGAANKVFARPPGVTGTVILRLGYECAATAAVTATGSDTPFGCSPRNFSTTSSG